MQRDRTAARSMPESAGAAGERERHGEAVARRFEIRATYVRRNALARTSNVRQRRRTCYVAGAAEPSQLDLLAARM